MPKFEAIIQPEEDKTEYRIEHGIHGGVVGAAYERGMKKDVDMLMDVRDRSLTVKVAKPLDNPLFIVIVG